MKQTPLGLMTLVMLVVAAMIGFGVFTSSGYALEALGNPGRVVVAWALCGLWAIAGALAYGALARRVPLSGGEYLYLSRLIHPSVGFLAGWISLVAGFTAPIAGAAKAVVVYGLPTISSSVTANTLATLVIVIASVCHIARVQVGLLAQNAIVLIKCGFVAVLLGWAFGATPSEAWQGAALPDRDPAWLPHDMLGWVDLLASMSWIAFSYAGFNAAIYVAGESRAAERNVPTAMLLATVLVTVIYVLLNILFVFGPSSASVLETPESKNAIAATATMALGGAPMANLTRLIVTLAVLSSVFGMLLAGPRVYWQMARDGVMPQFLNSQSTLPRAAVFLQAILSIVVVWLAQLEQIINYLSMTLSACSALTVASMWRLSSTRIAHALEEADPGKVQPRATVGPLAWWEQVSAIIYIVGTIVMLAAVVYQGQRRGEVFAVVGTIVVGLIVYGVWQLGSHRQQAELKQSDTA